MGTRISNEDFMLPLQFVTKSGDGIVIRIKIEVIAHLEDANVFKKKFILEPSKFDTSHLAEHLSALDEMKALVNAECAAYDAKYLCGDRDTAIQIAEKLTRPISKVLKERGLNLVEIERLSAVIVEHPSTGTLSAKGSKIWHMPFIFTAILLLIVVVGFIYYYTQMSKNVASLQGQLSSANAKASSLQNENSAYQSQVASLQGQLSSANAKVSSLQNENSAYQSQVASLQGQLSSANSKVSSLQNENSAYQSQVASLQDQLSSSQSTLQAANSQLQSQLSSAKSQITSLQNDVSGYQSQISSLKSQLSSLNDQVSSLRSQNSELQSIVNLSKSSVVANEKTINQSEGQSSSVVSFTAQYAGYVVVSGTSTTSNGYLMVTDTFNGYPHNGVRYSFGTGATCTIPILPGTVTVYFANSNVSGGATATLTVIYYY